MLTIMVLRKIENLDFSIDYFYMLKVFFLLFDLYYYTAKA